MKAVVEPLEGNRVKLSVQVDEEEFDKAVDAAFRKIAREVNVPGFRPGKVPRRILEARLGPEVGRSEALREALPDYYARAVRDNDLDAIAPPQIDITSGQESGPVAFDAVVEVRPRLRLAGYRGLRVEVPNPVVTDGEVDAEVDRLRGNFGELSPVERPARDGDYLTIDLKGSRGGEPVAGMTTDDFLYELGSGTVLPELDARLHGSRPGDIHALDAELPDGKVELRVLVKEVKEKLLPAVTDEWASEASEFDTVEELRADIAKRLALLKKVQARLALRAGTLDALVQLVAEDPPPSLVEAEAHRRLQELEQRLQAQGANVEQYLQATGSTSEQLMASLRADAAQSVKADLALRAVADAEGIEPGPAELDEEVVRLAAAYKVKPAGLRRDLERTGQISAVRSGWRKTKALEWLMDHVELVDTEGHPVDRALLEPDQHESEPPSENPTGDLDLRTQQ